MIASGGFVTVPAPGTPVNAAVNVPQYLTVPVKCHGFMFQALPGNTGLVYIGGQGMDKVTGAEVYAVIAIPPTAPDTTQLPSFSAALTISPNGLCLSMVFVDADQVDDGVLVSYLKT
jgi:hypothetical protein